MYEKVFFIIILFTLTVVISMNQQFSFANEQTVITKSFTMNKVVFDGKWTELREWKETAWIPLYGSRTDVNIRIAHQDNFIYIMLNVALDDTINKGKDKAIVCFDGQNDKTQIPNENDFCFISTLGRSSGVVLQGGSPLKSTYHFRNIPAPDDFIAISSSSGAADRYTGVPHPSYEYKIPIELFGKENIYGFYVGIYDSHEKKLHTWPTNVQVNNTLKVPSPSVWGEIISPDKSIPEFPMSILILVPAFLIIISINFIKNKII